jgi:hypothetical protein
MEVETTDAPVRNYGYMQDMNSPVSVEAPKEAPKEIPAEAPKEEPKVQVPKVEEPAKAEPKVEPKSEPKAEPKVEAPKPAEVSVSDWKSAIKTADKYEALKELGYDDFTIGMLKYKESTGDYTPYLEAKTVDYSKMTPEQLVTLEIRNQNKGMNEKALNFKINKELNEKYYLNREDYPENSDEAVYGQEQLRLDGENKRKALIEEQTKFKAPEPQPDIDATKRDADLQQQRATLGNLVMNNEATKNLQTAKSIVFGEGEASFNYPTDTQALVDSALNTIINSGKTDLTGVDLNVFYQTLAFGANPTKFMKEYADHLSAVAKDKLQKELGNVTPIEGGEPVTPPQVTKDYSYRTR